MVSMAHVRVCVASLPCVEAFLIPGDLRPGPSAERLYFLLACNSCATPGCACDRPSPRRGGSQRIAAASRAASPPPGWVPKYLGDQIATFFSRLHSPRRT